MLHTAHKVHTLIMSLTLYHAAADAAADAMPSRDIISRCTLYPMWPPAVTNNPNNRKSLSVWLCANLVDKKKYHRAQNAHWHPSSAAQRPRKYRSCFYRCAAKSSIPAKKSVSKVCKYCERPVCLFVLHTLWIFCRLLWSLCVWRTQVNIV